MKVVPYLIFNGDCEEAMKFYKRVLGGKLDIMLFDTMPPSEDMQVSEAWGKKVMHGSLDFGEDLTIYGSDAWEGSPATVGDNFSVHIDVDSEEQLRKIFDGLSEGGKVIMPVDKTFWGSVYGSLTDKYGVVWGFNYQIPE